VRDVKGTHITIIEKKTKKEKSVLIRKSLRKALDAYIKDKADFEYLFPSRKRKRGKIQPISPNMAYKIIRGAAKIGTHSMRKTFGYRLYLETKDIALLMDHFNHWEEKITLRYVGLLQDTLDDALEDFEL
jgi:integrase